MSMNMACRVCLAYDVRMHLILNTELQVVYEKLTGNVLQNYEKPMMACYVCCSQLRRGYQLMQKALRAELMLNQILESGYVINSISTIDREANKLTDNLSISNIESSLTTVESESADKEELEERKEEFKEEADVDVKQDTISVCSDTNPADNTSDSEDDVPLNTISTKNTHKDPTIDGRVKRKQYIKGRGFKAREIFLSHDEQVQDLMQRAKTLNYQNSPYKCDFCFKGFVDTRAFANHMEKHDERSGQFVCKVCSLRYRSARLLRSHSAAAHSRLYQCDRCPHTTHTANQAREHEKWHDGHVYECQLCSQQFQKPTSYFTHLRKRHPTEYVCEMCGAAFVGSHGLVMHKSKTHRRDLPPQVDEQSDPAADRFCAECNIQFATLDAWKRHILSSVKHTLGDNKGGPCPICRVMVSRSGRAAHMSAHERALRPHRPPPSHGTPLACEQCGAKFVNRSKLQAHVRRVHLGLKYNKNIVCEVCGKKCTSLATLRYHQRTHSGERPHACACGRRFATTNLLRIHSRTHSGERPYSCALCHKTFTQKPALNRHYRVHTGAKPYECQYCSKTFSQSNSVKLHVRSVHLKLPPNTKKNKVQNTVPEDAEKTDKTLIQNL